jgi:hypothetical protein
MTPPRSNGDTPTEGVPVPPERPSRRARTEQMHPIALSDRAPRAKRESIFERTPAPFKIAAFIFGIIAAALSLGTVVYAAGSALATKAGASELSEVRERLIRVEARLDGVEQWLRVLVRRKGDEE